MGACASCDSSGTAVPPEYADARKVPDDSNKALESMGDDDQTGLPSEENENNESPAEPAEPALVLTIVGARGLRNADWIPGQGKSDTYCIVHYEGKEIHRTVTVKDTLEPFWREDVNIQKFDGKQAMTFHLYDQDYLSSDYLGKVELPPQAFAEEGFNGEVIIEEAGDGVQAYLRLKVQLRGKELPPGPPTELTVTADKANHQTWGLDLDTQDEELLFVTEVRPGPFFDANEKLAPEEQVIKSDFVLAVNGIRGTPATLLNEFKVARTITLHLTRSVETTICFEHKNRKLPLGLVFPEKPAGEALVVCAVEEGSAAEEYNKGQTNEMLKINNGDRIIAVGGYRGKAGELMDKMENIKRKGRVHIELMRATGEEAKAHFGLH